MDTGFVALELQAGLRDILPFNDTDAVVPVDLRQLCLELSYLVFVILGLPPEVQSTEDKEVLVLTGFVAENRTCKRLGPRLNASGAVISISAVSGTPTAPFGGDTVADST